MNFTKDNIKIGSKVLVESIVSGRFTEAEVVGLAYGYRSDIPTQAKVKYEILKGFLFKYAIEKTR